MLHSVLLALGWLFIVGSTPATAAPAPAPAPEPAAAAVVSSPYAPVQVRCPSSPLVRPARGLSARETSWVGARKPRAAASLASWLHSVNSGFDCENLPVVALTTSGGGFRSFLTGAGVVKGLDGREEKEGGNGSSLLAGLWQGLTYHAGLSGGAWLVSGLAGNRWQTVTSLANATWTPGLNQGLLAAGLTPTNPTYLEIARDIAAKAEAGFEIVLDDPWGRLLSEILLQGPDADVAGTLSMIHTFAPFTQHSVPFPLITAIGVDTKAGQCIPPADAPQYEFSPYEFGSWDSRIDAFANSRYLGTSFNNGKPANRSVCYEGYDNLGYVLGTSSNLFNEACVISTAIPPLIQEIFQDAGGTLTPSAEFAQYPNPFYGLLTASQDIATSQNLALVDGGETNQNDPIWPFLQPARRADVLLVNDNSADTSGNFPNGSEIYNTYQRARALGLSKMPVIPDASYFVSPANVGRPIFFGCRNPQQITILYLPNNNFTYPSGQPTLKLQYSPSETAGMISNGEAVAIQNGDKNWPMCVACAITQKTGKKQPAACAACLSKYCYN